MQFKFTLLFSLLFALQLTAQDVADLENFMLERDSFINNAGEAGAFISGGLVLPNSYNESFDSFSDWAISAGTDTETPGFLNQYSAIAGTGADASSIYAVAYAFSGTQINFTPEIQGSVINGLMVTNTTYAYLSMTDGDSFAKKFGGETGDDPDFFLLTIKGYRDGALTDESVEFYLADYRFEDNEMDYIVDEWTMVDLTSLGAVDSLSLELTSSDVGDFGMNTPAYIAIDNVMAPNIGLITSTVDPAIQADLSVYPNPTVEALFVDWRQEEDAIAQIFDIQGRLLQTAHLQTGVNRLNVGTLASGMYAVKIQTATGLGQSVFYKR